MKYIILIVLFLTANVQATIIDNGNTLTQGNLTWIDGASFQNVGWTAANQFAIGAGYRLPTNTEITTLFDDLNLVDAPTTNIDLSTGQYWTATSLGCCEANYYNVQYDVISTAFTNSQFDALLVSSVPIPAAVWLFGSGLLGLVGVGRRAG